MYPPAAGPEIRGPPVKNTHDYNHPYGKVVAALHMDLTASRSAMSHRAAASQRGSLSYDVAGLETGSREGSRVVVFVRPKVLLPSNGAQHAFETQRLRELFPAEFEDAAGRPTRVWILNVDRGNDEDMTYYVTVYACVHMFLRQGLALLVVAARAAGHSASNWHEQPQSHITAALAGAFFPCNKHGEPSFTAKGKPATEIDADVMRQNLLHECNEIAKLIGQREAYGVPITAVLGTAVTAGHIGNAELLQHRGTRGADAGPPLGEEEKQYGSARPGKSSAKQAGCSCDPAKGDACTARCKSCAQRNLPCTLFCKCKAKCANPSARRLPGKKTLEELGAMSLEAIVALCTPHDLEVFAADHAIRTMYCLQVPSPLLDCASIHAAAGMVAGEAVRECCVLVLPAGVARCPEGFDVLPVLLYRQQLRRMGAVGETLGATEGPSDSVSRRAAVRIRRIPSRTHCACGAPRKPAMQPLARCAHCFCHQPGRLHDPVPFPQAQQEGGGPRRCREEVHAMSLRRAARGDAAVRRGRRHATLHECVAPAMLPATAGIPARCRLLMALSRARRPPKEAAAARRRCCRG